MYLPTMNALSERIERDIRLSGDEPFNSAGEKRTVTTAGVDRCAAAARPRDLIEQFKNNGIACVKRRGGVQRFDGGFALASCEEIKGSVHTFMLTQDVQNARERSGAQTAPSPVGYGGSRRAR